MSINRRPAGMRRGGALLAVLWLSAALGAIAFAIAGTVRGEVERTSNSVDGTRAYYLASGGIQRAIVYMLWAAATPDFRGYARGTPLLRLQFPSGEVVVEIVPDAAKIDINTASVEVLYRLLSALGVEAARARTIALGIIDWRSPAGPESPFDQYYLSLVPSFRARHASFEETEELMLIRDMTPEIYYGTYIAEPEATAEGLRLTPHGGMAECVTVFGTGGPVDVNTAPPAVLWAIGVPPDLIAAIVRRRLVAPFTMQQVIAMQQAAGPAAGRLTVGGNSIYTLRATARLRLPNGQLGDLRRTVAAQVKLMPPGYDSPFHVLRWYDTAWVQ
jgi:general secretion pathway protein K